MRLSTAAVAALLLLLCARAPAQEKHVLEKPALTGQAVDEQVVEKNALEKKTPAKQTLEAQATGRTVLTLDDAMARVGDAYPDLRLSIVGGGWWALRRMVQARYLLDTPTSKIRSAAQGYVELYGVLQGREAPVLAPLSNTPCLWWRFKIEEYSSSDKRSSWRVVESGSL